MASAKEYFNSKRNELYSEEYKSGMKKHRQKVLRISLISTAVVILCCIGIYVYNVNRVYGDFTVLKKTEIKNDHTMVKYYMLGDNIISCSLDGISCYDRNFKALWNQSYEMKKPMLDICESYVAVCDTEGTKFYVLNEEGRKGEVDTQLPIKRIAVANPGVVAVLLEDGDVSRINYYDYMGTLLAENKIPIEKNGYPMNISLSNDGVKMAVSYMTLETGNVRTKLAFYNFDSVGANEIDHLVSAQEYDATVVPEVEFVNATTAVAFGDDFLDIFQGSQKPVEQCKIEIKEEIQSIFYNEAYVGVVLENTGNAPYMIKVYDLKGKEVFSTAYEENYDQVMIRNENIYVLNENTCTMYNLKGKKKFQGDFGGNIVGILPLEEDRLIVILDGKMQTVKLK